MHSAFGLNKDGLAHMNAQALIITYPPSLPAAAGKCCGAGMASLRTVLVPGMMVVAIALGIVNMEKSKQGGELYEYQSQGWLRSHGVWDSDNRRFLVSFMEGGVGQIRIGGSDGVLKEETLVKDADYAGNATLGMDIDRQRNRLVVAVADFWGNRYSGVAAYDLKTWERSYLVHLSGPGDAKSMANDVAVDLDGNAYITDAKGDQIWKVNSDGSKVSLIRSPLFRSVPSKLPLRLLGLNGIVYHPDGFVLAIHSWAGVLFKISLDGEHASVVKMNSLLLLGDGLALLSPEKLVVAGTPSARLVESTDGWKSARTTHRYVGPMHRVATAALAREDGKALVSHMVGFPRHVITEAVFVQVNLTM